MRFPTQTAQRRRDKRAAKRLPVSLLKRQGWAPRRIVTDGTVRISV